MSQCCELYIFQDRDVIFYPVAKIQFNAFSPSPCKEKLQSSALFPNNQNNTIKIIHFKCRLDSHVHIISINTCKARNERLLGVDRQTLLFVKSHILNLSLDTQHSI